MKLAAIHITNIITGLPDYNTLLPEGLFWEIAPESTRVPFATYTLEENTPPSKDFEGVYTAIITIWASSMDGAVDVADQLKADIKNKLSGYNGWKFKTMRSGYSSGDANEGFISITYNFNL